MHQAQQQGPYAIHQASGWHIAFQQLQAGVQGQMPWRWLCMWICNWKMHFWHLQGFLYSVHPMKGQQPVCNLHLSFQVKYSIHTDIAVNQVKSQDCHTDKKQAVFHQG